MLLYESESWVVTGAMFKLLEEFHHRLEIRIKGMMTLCTMIGEWEWHPVAESLETAGLLLIKYYIHWSQTTIVV